jgi:hypothetical protein
MHDGVPWILGIQTCSAWPHRHLHLHLHLHPQCTFFLATTSTEHYVHSCRKRFRRSSSLAMPIAKTRRLHAAASHQCIPSLLRNGTEAGADLGKWRNPRSISSLQKTVKAMASVSSYVQSTRCIWLFSPFYWHPSTKNRRLIIERAGIYRNQNVTECRCTD